MMTRKLNLFFIKCCQIEHIYYVQETTQGAGCQVSNASINMMVNF